VSPCPQVSHEKETKKFIMVSWILWYIRGLIGNATIENDIVACVLLSCHNLLTTIC